MSGSRTSSAAPARRLRVLLTALAVLLFGRACGCEEPTEEERLREQVDTTKVHLYVAAKVAIAGDPDDPDVARARALFEQAGDRTAQSQASDLSDLEPAEALALITALWKLRGIGKEHVRLGRQSDLPPVIAALLGGDDTVTPFAADIDAATDHGLLLVGLAVLKFHPRTPMPIANEILLYEAWMTESPDIQIDAVRPVAAGVKAYVLATNDYCDMAKVETDFVHQHPPLPTNAFALLGGLGRLAAHAPEAASMVVLVAMLPDLTRVLAHGSTAICFHEREEEAEANQELSRMVEALEAAGVPEAEVAPVRAYLAYGAGDLEAARRHLQLARSSVLLDDEARADIDELIEYLDQDDRHAFSAYFDKAYFAAFTLRVIWNRLESSGAFDAILEVEPFRSLHAFLTTLTGAMDRGRDAIPSVDDIGERASGWFDQMPGCGR